MKIRELRKSDIPMLNRWRNDMNLVEYLGTPFRYVNSEVDDAWYDNYMRDRRCTVRCAIVDENTNTIIGCVYLLNIDWTHRSAELGIMIGRENNQDKGIGTLAVQAMLRHAFFHINLHRVYLTVLADNERAKRVYQKCGFQIEAIKREAIYKRGNYVDMLVMAAVSRM